MKPELIEHPTLWGELVFPFESVVLFHTIGWVESWGTIEEYEFGYRSERARILSLVTLPHHLDGVDTYNHRTLEVAERYGLPVVDIFDPVPA